MADFQIRVSTETEEAKRKLQEVDREATKVERQRNIEFNIPSLEQTKKSLEEFGEIANTAFQVFKQVHPVGQALSDLEDPIERASEVAQNLANTLQGYSRYVNPIRGIKETFNDVKSSVQTVVTSTAAIGFAILGVTQSVNLLKEAFGGMFDDTVGREIKLREQLLETATTLASTNRVLLKGVEIEDPTKKLQALEKPIEASIERLRVKSLEIAGTTSDAVIQTFSIVASQIGNFGGSLKDAEDLAVKFSGALGTLGLADPNYASQEIGSILLGNIGPDSVLAKTLGITNKDIEKAKKSAGGLVEFINSKLETFEAGQKKAALGFRGITSNIKDLSEEIKRSFGAPILDAVLDRLNKFYTLISGKAVTNSFLKTARGVGTFVATTALTTASTVADSKTGRSLNGAALSDGAKNIESAFAQAAVFIQKQFERAATSIQNIVDRIAAAIKTLVPSLAEIGAVLAQLKFDQIQIQVRSYADLAQTVARLASAYSVYLDLIKDAINTPIGRYINELTVQFKILEAAGVMSVVRLVASLMIAWKSIVLIKDTIIGLAVSIRDSFNNSTSVVARLFERLALGVISILQRVTLAITVGVSTLIQSIIRAVTTIEIALNAFSMRLLRMGGSFAALSTPVYRLSQAFGAVNDALNRTSTRVNVFASELERGMQRARTAVQNTSYAISTLGDKLGNVVVRSAKQAGNAIIQMGVGMLRGIAIMTTYQVVVTAVFDGLRRLGEWWENRDAHEEYVKLLEKDNTALIAMANNARKASTELDAVTEAILNQERQKLKDAITPKVEEYKKLQDELIKQRKAEEQLEQQRNSSSRSTQKEPNAIQRLLGQYSRAEIEKINAAQFKSSQNIDVGDNLLNNELLRSVDALKFIDQTFQPRSSPLDKKIKVVKDLSLIHI